MPVELVQEKLNTVPSKPGVYLYRNARNTIIYVGKAINLRNRVRSYFHASAEHSHKTIRLVQEIADLEWIITETELEALILEANLIKKHRPHFNVRLKDDKRYPYIKIEWQNDFPKVLTVRKMEHDGGRYYGPYTNSGAVHATLDTVRRIFPYLTCDRVITGTDSRACLYYDIKLCTAPCIGAISKDDYRATLDRLSHFLEGKTDAVVAEIERKMQTAGDALDFERAAQYRDQLRAIEHIVERQKVVSTTGKDQDVIAFARDDTRGDACVQVFFIRQGRLIGREYFVLEGTEEEATQAVMAGFLKQFYDEAAMVPPEVLLQVEVEEANIIQQWLRQKRGAQVVLDVPHEGPPAELVSMAAENAAETLNALQTQWAADEHRNEKALNELAEGIGLEGPPARIECFDISTMQGTATTASMVVFVKGLPRKNHYRKFNIKTVDGRPDDFASMREVLTRRFKRYFDAKADDAKSTPGRKRDESFSLLPDLLIIDGGKGQLGIAVEVLKEFELFGQIPVCGLAKQREEIFLPGRPDSIMLPRRSQGLYLIQRIRDEAHRFAITAHRSLRAKKGIASQLDTIPGVGPAKRRALLKHFGSIDAIRAASVDEIAEVPGIPLKLANTIKQQL